MIQVSHVHILHFYLISLWLTTSFIWKAKAGLYMLLNYSAMEIQFLVLTMNGSTLCPCCADDSVHYTNLSSHPLHSVQKSGANESLDVGKERRGREIKRACSTFFFCSSGSSTPATELKWSLFSFLLIYSEQGKKLSNCQQVGFFFVTKRWLLQPIDETLVKQDMGKIPMLNLVAQRQWKTTVCLAECENRAVALMLTLVSSYSIWTYSRVNHYPTTAETTRDIWKFELAGQLLLLLSNKKPA